MPHTVQILLREPNEGFQQSLIKVIEALPLKIEVTATSSDEDFSKKLAERAWGLAILDHKTNHPKGDRLLDHLMTRSEFPKVNRVLITSIHLNEAGKPTEMGEIPFSFLSKPFRLEVLESTLMAVIQMEAPAKDPKWKLDVRLLNPFVQAFLESCDESAKSHLTRKGVDLRKEKDLCDLSVTSVFDQGDLFGNFTIAFPAQSFLEYSKKITKQEERSVHQRNLHLAEDFLSTVVKKVRESLEARKLRLSFRSPVVTMGRQHLAPSIHGLQPLVISFESEEGFPLHLELSMQKNLA